MTHSRRTFLKHAGLALPGSLEAPSVLRSPTSNSPAASRRAAQPTPAREFAADLIILGGGFGGCAAALAAAQSGLRVIMTEETDWIGGQLTAQAVPLDENSWIEKAGAPCRPTPRLVESLTERLTPATVLRPSHARR